MIVSRFRSVGWVAGVATAALGCYLVSQSVAAERAGLAKVDRTIADTQNDIRRLRTEIGARSRMGQLDRWNADVLALQAPGARQFVGSEVQLASLNGAARPLPIDPDVAATRGAVQQAAYQAPPAPPPAAAPAVPPPPAVAPAAEPAPQPLLHVATYVKPKLDRLASAEAAPVVKVAFARPARPVPAAEEAPHAKPADKAGLGSLLPDDIDSLAAAERKARKAGGAR